MQSFAQLTAVSARSAVALYFDPVRRLAAWISGVRRLQKSGTQLDETRTELTKTIAPSLPGELPSSALLGLRSLTLPFETVQEYTSRVAILDRSIRTMEPRTRLRSLRLIRETLESTMRLPASAYPFPGASEEDRSSLVRQAAQCYRRLFVEIGDEADPEYTTQRDAARDFLIAELERTTDAHTRFELIRILPYFMNMIPNDDRLFETYRRILNGCQDERTCLAAVNGFRMLQRLSLGRKLTLLEESHRAAERNLARFGGNWRENTRSLLESHESEIGRFGPSFLARIRSWVAQSGNMPGHSGSTVNTLARIDRVADPQGRPQ